VTGAPGLRQGNIVCPRKANRSGGQLLPIFLEPEGRGQHEGFKLADGRTFRLGKGVGNEEMVKVF
jgi:hypothetical protein